MSLNPTQNPTSLLNRPPRRFSGGGKACGEELNRQLFDTVQRIHELSSEYYHLMPKRGYEYVRLEPIDSDQTLRAEMSRVKNTLEFEAAERLILGAQYREAKCLLNHKISYLLL